MGYYNVYGLNPVQMLFHVDKNNIQREVLNIAISCHEHMEGY